MGSVIVLATKTVLVRGIAFRWLTVQPTGMIVVPTHNVFIYGIMSVIRQHRLGLGGAVFRGRHFLSIHRRAIRALLAANAILIMRGIQIVHLIIANGGFRAVVLAGLAIPVVPVHQHAYRIPGRGLLVFSIVPSLRAVQVILIALTVPGVAVNVYSEGFLKFRI